MAIKLPLIMASQSSIFHPVTNHLQLVESFTLQTDRPQRAILTGEAAWRVRGEHSYYPAEADRR